MMNKDDLNDLNDLNVLDEINKGATMGMDAIEFVSKKVGDPKRVLNTFKHSKIF